MSFNRLGPFYRLQRRLGLLSDTDLAASRRAVLFIAIGWVPVLVLALLQGVGLGGSVGRSFLLDYSAYAFAIATGAFVLMEETSDRRLVMLVSQFTARDIVPETSIGGFRLARANMERRTGLRWAEAAILVLAYLLAYVWLRQGADVAGGRWFGVIVDGSLKPTLAGWWTLLVALPLYWFLMGRWLWRFGTWGLMLYDIARCDMRLVATHPDRCGGLAFIGQYPNTYVLFVFALSTVVSSTVLKLVVHGNTGLESFKFALIGMVVFFMLAFAVPLLVFAPKLARLKREGLKHYGSLASRHNLQFEAKWIGSASGPAHAQAQLKPAEPSEELLGAPDPSSLADLAAGYDLVKRMIPVPITKESFIPVLIAAVAPFVCVAATQVPFAQVVGALKGLLLL